jgi:hypothetical protein
LDRLHKLFVYDAETGELTNRSSRGKAKAGERSGTLKNDGYRLIKIDGISYREHRVIWKLVHQQDPEHLLVDHINGVPNDNRLANLRLATGSQQQKNKPLRSDNRSGITGVSWDKRTGKWRAAAKEGTDYLYLGEFDTLLDAAAARLSYENKHTDSLYFRQKVAA